MGDCTVEGCDRTLVARGLCSSHYAKAYKRGELPARPNRIDTFWTKVDFSGVCWVWTGYLTAQGYGRFNIDWKSHTVHRLAYELLVGPVPDGLVLDHLCRNRACVNPAHLEPVTNRENVMRGIGPTAIANRATACVNGHPFTPENTIVTEHQRVCRTCRNERSRRKRAEATTTQVDCPRCGKSLSSASLRKHLRTGCPPRRGAKGIYA